MKKCGQLFLNLKISLAEYERELRREEINARLQNVKFRGRLESSPKGYTP